MPVIAIVNRKGGSGKSTLATHLAAYCANAGLSVMLGDVDQQQSTQAWLRLRAANTGASRPLIRGWKVEPSRGMRPPAGTTHVVLDTPGGLTGFELARVVMFADAIVMPVCNSVFDLESAAQCLAELRALPRVASGRCKLAVVGMRVDANRQATRRLRNWCETQGLPLLCALRDTPAYVRCIEQGLTIFDLPPRQVQADRLQWEPLLAWLAPVLAANPVSERAEAPHDRLAPAPPRANAPRPPATPADAHPARMPERVPRASTVQPPAHPARPVVAEPSLHAFHPVPAPAGGFGLGRLLRCLMDLRPKLRRPSLDDAPA